MDRKQIFGLVGSVILFLGVFAPFMSLPIVGSMNYFQNGKGDGLIILIIAVASFVLTLTNRYKWLSVTGLVSLGILIYTLLIYN